MLPRPISVPRPRAHARRLIGDKLKESRFKYFLPRWALFARPTLINDAGPGFFPGLRRAADGLIKRFICFESAAFLRRGPTWLRQDLSRSKPARAGKFAETVVKALTSALLAKNG